MLKQERSAENKLYGKKSSHLLDFRNDNIIFLLDRRKILPGLDSTNEPDLEKSYF